MAKRIIKPDSGNTLVLQEDNGSIDALTVETNGDVTLGGNLVIPDSGTIGSASDTDAITIDASGNVGIGTDNPAHLLHVFGTIPRIQLTDSDTGADHLINASSSVGSLAIQCDINSEGSSPSLQFTVAGSERLRIDSSGNVLIQKEDSSSTGVSNNAGVTINQDQGTNISAITVSGDSSSGSHITYSLYSNTAGQYQYYVSYDGEVNYRVGLNNLSDIREKQNISDSTIGLNEVLNLSPKTFQWLNSEDDKYYIGFVAQDVQEVIPSIVSERLINEEEETRFGINIDQLIPILTKAIQEQQALIESQQSQIDALTARIEALENAAG